MNGATLLQHAAGVIENRERAYGPAQSLFEHVACRWSLVLGTKVTSAQVTLCLIDLKLARLTRTRPTSTPSSMSPATLPACAR